MAQEKQASEIIAILAETPLAVLIESLQTGKFQPPPDDPVEEGEKIIGEMTDVEKSIHSACVILDNRAAEIAELNNRMVEDAKRTGADVDELQVFLNKAEHEATVEMIKGLSAVLWHSIRKRIGAPAKECDGIGIRDGYKIVSYESDEHDVFARAIMGFFSKDGGARRF